MMKPNLHRIYHIVSIAVIFSVLASTLVVPGSAQALRAAPTSVPLSAPQPVMLGIVQLHLAADNAALASRPTQLDKPYLPLHLREMDAPASSPAEIEDPPIVAKYAHAPATVQYDSFVAVTTSPTLTNVIFLPLIYSNWQQITMPGLSFIPPKGWQPPAPITVPPTATNDLTGTATTRLYSPDGAYFMEVIVDWFAPPPPEAIFGNFARPPLDRYQEIISQLHTGEPVQILRATKTMSGSVFLLAHAAFRLAHGSYSLGLYGEALDEQRWEVFSDTLNSVVPNLATLPPPIRTAANKQPVTYKVSLASPSAAQAVSYDPNAAVAYAQIYVDLFNNSDGCYLWTDDSSLGCSYWGGAWGVDGAHFANRALSAGGQPIPGLWDAVALRSADLRDWLLANGGQEIADPNALQPGDIIFFGTEGGCNGRIWGWEGVVIDQNGPGPRLHLHSRIYSDGSTGNWAYARYDQVLFNACGPTNRYSFVHVGTGGGGDTTPPEITIVETWKNGEGALSVQARITDDSGVVAAYDMSVDTGSNGQIGRALAPFPGSSYGADIYAGTIVNIPSADVVYFTLMAQDPSGNTTWAHADSNGRVWYSHLTPGDCTGTCGNPINSSSGEKTETAQDLTVPGRSGTDILIQRAYRSQTDYIGPFGKGWSFTYDYVLEKVNNPLLDGVHVRYPDGHTANYQHDGNGRYNSISPGSHEYLLREGDGYALYMPDQTVYHFDSSGHLSSIVNAKGGEITLHYSGGHLSTVTNASARTVAFDFTGERITSITIGPKLLTYQYEGDHLKTFTDATRDSMWVYEYDANGFLSQVQTPEGLTKNTQTYNERGEVQSQTVGTSRTLNFQLDQDQRQMKVSDIWGNTTTHTRDDKYRLVLAQSARGYTQTFGYDNDNNLIAYTNQASAVWHYRYDANGNMIYRADPVDGTSYTGRDETFWLYDENNRLISMTNSLGYTTRYDYDGNGNLVHTYYPDGGVITNTYYSDGQLQSRTDPIGNTTTYYYYPTGDLWKVVDPLGHPTTYEYDVLGRKTAEIDANGNRTTFRYNGRDQMIERTDLYSQTMHYQYDADGRLTDEWNRTNGHTHYEYSTCCGLLNQVTDAEGGIIEYGYNEMNQRIWMRDPNGNMTEYKYDEDYRLIEEISPPAVPGGERGHTYYFYDSRGNVIRKVDPAGDTTRYVYDVNNRLKQTIDAEGNVTEYCYDTEDRLVTQFDPRRAETRTVYDSMGRRAKAIDALGHIVTYTYNLAGQLVATVELHDVHSGVAYTTTSQYDAAGRRTATVDPLGKATRYAYDGVGNTILITDANSIVTRKEYDQNNRLIAVTQNYTTTRPSDYQTNVITRYGYDAEGRQITITNALGNTTYYGYDQLGRTLVITAPMGQITYQGYDANGNLVTVTNALSGTTVYGYDGLNRRVWERNPLHAFTYYDYDLAGRRTAITDANGIVTRYGYDRLGRAISVTENYSTTGPINHQTNVVTLYAYDEVGNRTVITDARGNATTYSYNFINQLVRETNPLVQSQWYAYDDAGHLIRQVDGEWQATYYEYDGVGRRTAILYGSSGQRVDFGYDAVGNQVSMTDTTGVTTYIYDALNRPLTITSPLTGVVGYRYDAMGNRTQLIYPGGQVVTYTYDAANRLASVVDWAGQHTTYEYDVLGRMITATLPNGILTVNTYDAADRLIRLIHSREGSQTLGDYQFALDAVGNRLVVTETLAAPTGMPTLTLPLATRLPQIITPTGGLTFNWIQSQITALGSLPPSQPSSHAQATVLTTTVISYTYDPLYRPTRADYSSGEQFDYAYDASGNVLTYTQLVAGQNVTTTYTCNASNQLVTAKASDDPITWHYTYDANGSLTDVTPNGTTPGNGARRYTYNRAGYLVRAEIHDGNAYQPQAEMVYNGQGQRVSLTAWTVELSLTTYYVLDPVRGAEPLAATSARQTTFYIYGHGPLAELSNGWIYYLADGNRTVRQLSNLSGAITLLRSYTPWGELLEQHGTGDLTWGYFGGLMDVATGLIYVGDGQYYDPKTGRFLSPVGKGRNPYVPASRGDPLGALLAPVALVGLLARRKRVKDKWIGWLVVLILLVGVSTGLTACQPTPTPVPTPQPPTTPPQTPTPAPPPSTPGQTPTVPPPASTPICTPTPTPTQPSGTAYITIDDGPGGYTSQVLDILAQYQVKATFFLVGNRIQSYPDEVVRMHKEGHAIGVHSWDHPDWGQLSSEDQANQIQQAQNVLQETIGETSNLFRAPGGAQTYASIPNLYNYNWTVDSNDWRSPDASAAQTVKDNVFSTDIGDKPIILIHSIHPVDPPALELIIKELKIRGYCFGILPRPGDNPGALIGG